MTTRALLFDRDGVLTYFDVPAATTFFAPLLPISVWEIAHAWQQFGARHGFPASPAAERSFFASFWDEIADHYQVAAPVRATLHALDYTRFVCAFPDARPALTLARDAGYRIGVLSNFSLASLDASLAAAGLADLVDASCAATVIGATKPHFAAYATAAAALGVERHECLFFDDETVCVTGARDAGMRAWLVDRAGRSATYDGVLHSLHEVATVLGQTV